MTSEAAAAAEQQLEERQQPPTQQQQSQDEVGFVMVMNSRTYETMRFGYTAATTLSQLKRSVRRDLFHHPSPSSSSSSAADATTTNDTNDGSGSAFLSDSSLAVDGILQLFWLGKELKSGCSWHSAVHGFIDDEETTLMKDLDSFFEPSAGNIVTLTQQQQQQQRPVIHAHFVPPDRHSLLE